VVWIGPELTPWLEGAAGDATGGAASLACWTPRGRIGGYADGGDMRKGRMTRRDEDAHDHGHGAEDPHAWLDPDNAQVWLGLIAARLGELDPENAATYTANAAAAATEVAALDAGIVARLAAVKGTPVMTFHDAYGYFGAHYGLNFAGSIALGDAASPGAARLVELRARCWRRGTSSASSPKSSTTRNWSRTDGRGDRVPGSGRALDPVGSTLEPGPGAYAELMRRLARGIAECAAG
jgi:zinc transport system substrate-binding protein